MTTSLIEVLIFFVAVSLLLYVLLGGADFGAGILEILPMFGRAEDHRKLVDAAIGPVWEANHMWLILLVVIGFTGFPEAFQVMMVSLHLPILALLIGIVVRGSVFVFRHYDPDISKKTLNVYTWIFGLSSLWTALWLGVIASSFFLGRIDTDAKSFHAAYVAPWWGLAPFAMGLFVAANCVFLASIFLIGESEDENFRRFLRRRGALANVVLIVTGGCVFAAFYVEHKKIIGSFLQNSLAMLCLVGATASFVALWSFTRHEHVWRARVTAALQTTFILVGWYCIQFPNILVTRTHVISFYESAAPEKTLLLLVIALLVGSLLIFPSLFYLFLVFKLKDTEPARET